MRPRIGIAITTYNRRDQLLRLVHSLRQHCRDQVHLAVFDDGSSDGTAAAVAPLVDAVLEAPNGGIPTNKNRALFYFLALQPVDQLILLELLKIPGGRVIFVDLNHFCTTIAKLLFFRAKFDQGQ